MVDVIALAFTVREHTFRVFFKEFVPESFIFFEFFTSLIAYFFDVSFFLSLGEVLFASAHNTHNLPP